MEARARVAGVPVRVRRGGPLWVVPVVWTVGLGLWGLSRDNSVWRDEAATWQVARRSTADIWYLLGQVDAVHGLYYLLMHALFTCFGPGTTTLRLPSVLAVAVAAGCVTVIGQRLTGNWAGLGAGLALGLLPAVQFHLQEGRPYALVMAGAAVSTLLLVMLLERPASWWWAAYGVTVLLCGLLNWLALLVLVAHAVTLCWAGAGRGTWVRWASASGAALAGTAPLILFSRHQSEQISWIPPLTWHMLIGPAILLAIGTLGALLDRPLPDRPSVASVGLPLLAVPLLALTGISLIQPLFLDRYVLFGQLGLTLLIGTALGRAIDATAPRFPRTARLILPLALLSALGALLPYSLAKRSPESRVDDVLSAADRVHRLKHPGDAVLFIPAARRDTALVSPDAFRGLRDIALTESPVASGTLKGVETEPSRIRTAILRSNRILLVTDAPGVAKRDSAHRDKAKRAALRRYFRAVADETVRGRRVTVYERLPAPVRGPSPSGRLQP
ncbi:glycosyltransferase family 39 protein [Streptomyces bauhiniae]|uniref:glycosyltransferase family 39 protein n=1 Tax=Streptomyces bauhiniae TaxID=2340725 RepID=UPI0035E16862